MAWYLFALLDAPPRSRAVPGLGRAGVSIRRVAGCFVAMERRAEVPPIGLATLKAHEQAVAHLALAVPAILPVRFGTLVDLDQLEAVLTDRREEIHTALDLVRNRQQMTWRLRRPARIKMAPTLARPSVRATSGTAYLRSRAAAARPAPPAALRSVHVALRALVAAERYQPRGTTLPDSLYHLVPRPDVAKYFAIAAGLSKSSPALSVSGPWPPYAFAPELV